MAHLDKISTRYAKAIYEYLKSEAKVRPVVAALRGLAQAVMENATLKNVLATELFSPSQRRGVIEDLCSKMAFDENTKRVLLVLSEQGRLTHLSQIAERLNQLVLESANTVPLTVTAALELAEDDKKKIENKFKKILGKEVEASYQINPELFGGLKVTAGGRTFDGSLSGWLSKLEEKLIGGRI